MTQHLTPMGNNRIGMENILVTKPLAKPLADVLPELSRTLNDLYDSDPAPYDITMAIMKRIEGLELEVMKLNGIVAVLERTCENAPK